MEKTLRQVLFAILLFAATLAQAENYPYRADYLWTTIPDHPSWLYKTGENAKIEVTFLKYGIPRDALVSYEIGNDMLASDKTGSVKLKDGRGIINMGSRRTPGFRDLRLRTTIDGVNYEHHIKVGFSVDKIEPYTAMPSDFDSFWKSNIDEMHRRPLSYTKDYVSEYSTNKMDCYLVKMLVDQKGHSIYAYLFYPKGAKAHSCPVVLCPPGAGVKTIKEPLLHRYYAESGCIRMEMEIHGLDPRLSQSTFDDLSRAYGSYLNFNLADRDQYYMKHVYLSLIRAIDLLTSLPEWDGKNVAVQGGSQGGALSIVAAGLEPRVTLCCANHPALADMAGYVEKGRTGGYPHFNHGENMFTDANVKTMAYYDVVNFARRVKCKTRMTWGYNDITCPPTTSYAVWNVLTCPKESLITPINEHWTSEATERGHCTWIMNNLLK